MGNVPRFLGVVSVASCLLVHGCRENRDGVAGSNDGKERRGRAEPPKLFEPTRAQAIARIAELGGRTAPPAPTPNDRVSQVHLSGTQATDADLRLLVALPELQHLDLSDTGITDDGLKHVAVLKELCSLKLKKTSVTGAGLAHLKNLPRLGHLDVTDAKVQESDLARLKGIKSLRSVLPFPRGAFKAWLVEGELESTAWVTSRDKGLSLRVLTPKRHYAPSEAVILLAELRNDSKRDWVVLRPFGDEPRVITGLMAIRGPKGRVKYSGPAPSYRLGRGSVSPLGPGQVIRDHLELPVSLFRRFDAEGEYFFKLWYNVHDAHYGKLAARWFPDRKLWTGEMRSKELKITKSRK